MPLLGRQRHILVASACVNERDADLAFPPRPARPVMGWAASGDEENPEPETEKSALVQGLRGRMPPRLALRRPAPSVGFPEEYLIF